MQEVIFKKAIKLWGEPLQKMMAIEEMSELTKEIVKSIRGKDNKDKIAEEIADVDIMLCQLKIMYGVHDDVEKHREFKIKRLQGMIETSPCIL